MEAKINNPAASQEVVSIETGTSGHLEDLLKKNKKIKKEALRFRSAGSA